MKLNGSLNLVNEIKKIEDRIPAQEYILGRALKQPFPNTNSGSRKIMHGTQTEQAIQISNPEPPILSTGYENEYGYMSSNYITSDNDYEVLAKIDKFSKLPNNHYWLILYSRKDNYVTMQERTPYHHISEFFGYLYDNNYLDNLNPGSTIKKGDVISKPASYDEYENRAEGLNLTTMYTACEFVKEDPIVISESAAKRFSCNLIDKIEIKINDNDILLNLYGPDDDHTVENSYILNTKNMNERYITFPDIGQKVKDNIFCAVRRELKDEESLFTQSWDRLKSIMMTDKKYLCDNGTVVDINVYCNNPEKLEGSMYNNQIKKYHNDTVRFAKEFVQKVKPILFDADGQVKEGLIIDYNLKKMYRFMEGVANGIQYIKDKVFSNIVIEVYIQYNKPLQKGDKITDRYGGKGVISRVIPDNLMPKYLKNGKWRSVDVLYSMCTCINRLNDGQLFETSITYIGWQLTEYMRECVNDYNVMFALIHKYLYMLNPEYAAELAAMYKFSYGGPDLRNDESNARFGSSPDDGDEQFDRDMYIEQILHDGYIAVSIPPSINMNIDIIRNIYNEFPFIQKYCQVYIPMQDSTGKYRMVPTRRKLVLGYKYIFRLKQLAEEKFSAVSLASTNIRNENSKSRLAKTHNARFPSTPVRIYGEMESSSITAHLGIDTYIEEFALNSSSPEARQLNRALLTCDPFSFDIKLDENCVCQTADILQAFLKVLGERLCFHKVEKFHMRPVIKIIAEKHGRYLNEIAWHDKAKQEDIKTNGVHAMTEEDYKRREEFVNEQIQIDKDRRSKPLKQIATIRVGIKEEHEALEAYKKKLESIGVDPKYVLR